MTPFLTDSEAIIISKNYKEHEFKMNLNISDGCAFRTALWEIIFSRYTIEICHLNGDIKYIGEIDDLLNNQVIGR